MFGATRLAQSSLPTSHRRCTRCGLIRESRSSTELCKSCRAGMTAREIKEWLT